MGDRAGRRQRERGLFFQRPCTADQVAGHQFIVIETAAPTDIMLETFDGDLVGRADREVRKRDSRQDVSRQAFPVQIEPMIAIAKRKVRVDRRNGETLEQMAPMRCRPDPDARIGDRWIIGPCREILNGGEPADMPRRDCRDGALENRTIGRTDQFIHVQRQNDVPVFFGNHAPHRSRGPSRLMKGAGPSVVEQPHRVGFGGQPPQDLRRIVAGTIVDDVHPVDEMQVVANEAFENVRLVLDEADRSDAHDVPG